MSDYEITFDIDGFILKQTCSFCPEQYDVYRDGAKVGYMRLRHGAFRVDNEIGQTVYRGNPEGDGCFEDEERDRFLTAGVKALRDDMNTEAD